MQGISLGPGFRIPIAAPLSKADRDLQTREMVGRFVEHAYFRWPISRQAWGYDRFVRGERAIAELQCIMLAKGHRHAHYP